VAEETLYAKSGDVHIAYKVLGTGPIDLVLAPGFISQIDTWSDEPEGARFLRGLSSFARLILFDKRGTGLSDRVPDHALPTLEQRTDDLRAVLDAVGCERAAVLGVSEGAAMGIFFAATCPSPVPGRVLYGAWWAYPWGKNASREGLVGMFSAMVESGWGQGVLAPLFAPSARGDARLERWCARWERVSASPGAVLALVRMMTETDVRAILPSLRVPTLVLHRTGDLLAPIAAARYLAKTIPGAILREHPGQDHLPILGDSDALVADIEEFLTGARPTRDPDHALAAILFTDIVGSTVRAAELGDRRWRALLDEHDAMAAREIERQRGRVVQSTGDGVLAVFDGPARAVRCAETLTKSMRSLGIEIRAGVHVGEIQLRGSDVAGLAVHTAARVMAAAGAGQVFVSGTVKDLVGGAGIDLVDQGVRELKGVPGEWRLFSATG